MFYDNNKMTTTFENMICCLFKPDLYKFRYIIQDGVINRYLLSIKQNINILEVSIILQYKA